MEDVVMTKNPQFSFVEYSYDPHTVSREIMAERLIKAGFAIRTVHNRTPISLWIQNHCILFLREAEGIDYPQVSGLGFIASQKKIDSMNIPWDNSIGMYRTGDTNGTRILFVDSQDVDNEVLSGDYVVVDNNVRDNTGLANFSGLIMGGFSRSQMDFYQEIGFKFTKSNDNHNVLLSSDNRFSIHINKSVLSSERKTLIAETPDIFASTAKLYLNGMKPDQLIDNCQNCENFDKLAHRIMGYNCFAQGNDSSYSIENIISDFIPNTDLLFRSRKKKLELSEESLEYFYGTKYKDLST